MSEKLSERLGETIETVRLKLILKYIHPNNEPDYHIHLKSRFRKNGKRIGLIGTYAGLHDNNNIMVGYNIDTRRKMGYATEALGAITAKLLSEGVIPNLEILTDNIASIKTAEKAGYQQVGAGRKDDTFIFAPNFEDHTKEM